MKIRLPFWLTNSSNLTGSEDMEIDHQTGVAWFSMCDLQYVVQQRQPARWRSAIYTYNLETRKYQTVNLDGIDFDEFCPHGISLNRDSNGVLRVFVVDHGRTGVNKSVTIFTYDESSNTLCVMYFSHSEIICLLSHWINLAVTSGESNPFSLCHPTI